MGIKFEATPVAFPFAKACLKRPLSGVLSIRFLRHHLSGLNSSDLNSALKAPRSSWELLGAPPDGEGSVPIPALDVDTSIEAESAMRM